MINVHIWGLFPLVTAFLGGRGGMRAEGVNAVTVSREPYPRGSAHLAVSEQDVHLTEHHVPILAPGVPVLDNPLGRQVQHPPQRIVIGDRKSTRLNSSHTS